MKKIKFLHCADIHLDMPFTSMGVENGKSSTRRQELKDTFQRIIDTAKGEKVDILIISGDLYEHNYVKKSTISFVNDKFNEIPGIEIFIVPGNHDPYISNSYYRDFKWGKNVHILTQDNPSAFLEKLNTHVYGVGFSNFYEEGCLVSGLKPADDNFFNILAVHGTVNMNFKQNAYNPMPLEVLEALNMDYIALGHFHSRTDRAGGSSRIYNPGSPEPLGFDEPGEHGVFVGCISKNDIGDKILDTKFVKLNKRFYESMAVNVDGCSTDEQVIARVLSAVEGKDNANGLFRITLKGYVESVFKINTEQIKEYFSNKFFMVKFEDETVADYNFDEIIKEPGLRGLFTRKMFSLIEKAAGEQDKKVLTKALYYGVEALEQREVGVS